MFKNIPDKTVVFLDDIERVIDTIDIHVLLGVINGLVEQHKLKVVVIANNSYIQLQGEDKLVFKEKVIEKTLVYEPDIETIFREICKKCKDGRFKEFMLSDAAVSVINPLYPAYEEDRGLQSDLRNIRILKFALNHFLEVYNNCKDFLNEKCPEANTFLNSLWASTVGISIEYKKNRLSYKDRKQFENYVEIATIDSLLFDVNEDHDVSVDKGDDKNESEKEVDGEEHNRIHVYVSQIFQRIVKSHSLPVIVSTHIFDFIVAGVSLDKDNLKSLWDNYKEQVRQNRESPAYKLLNCFTQSLWDISNEDMPVKLIELLQYVKEGVYENNISYVYATNCLQQFGSLINCNLDQIKKDMMDGIDKMYNKDIPSEMYKKLEAEVSHPVIWIPEECMWVVEYEKTKLQEVSIKMKENDIRNAVQLFNEDIGAFKNLLTEQYGSTELPAFVNFPILSQIPQQIIENKVNKIKPNEVMALCYILEYRFRKQAQDTEVIHTDFPFIKTLDDAIENRKNNKDKVFADFLIENHLKKLIDELSQADLVDGATFNMAIPDDAETIEFKCNDSTSSGKILSNTNSIVPIYGNMNGSTWEVSTIAKTINLNSNCNKMFSNKIKLKVIDFGDGISTSNVITMFGMFEGCGMLNRLIITKFDTSKVTDMGCMFSNCWSLQEVGVSEFDTSNVTKMNGMFNNCSGLMTLDVSRFNTSNVIDMNGMFNGCSKLKVINVSNFNTTNVLAMKWMFEKCSILNELDLSNFRTTNVQEMRCMFSDCINLHELDLSNFDFSKVNDMNSMCFNLSTVSKQCTIICTETAQRELENKTGIPTNGVTFTWVRPTSK